MGDFYSFSNGNSTSEDSAECSGDDHPFAKCPTTLSHILTVYVAIGLLPVARFVVELIGLTISSRCGAGPYEQGMGLILFWQVLFEAFKTLIRAVFWPLGLISWAVYVVGMVLGLIIGLCITGISELLRLAHSSAATIQGDVEMAQAGAAGWRRRGWLVMLRSREQPRLARGWRRYVPKYKKQKKFEPASVLLEREDDSSGHSQLGSPARVREHPHALVVAVLRIQQDELFREILLWL